MDDVVTACCVLFSIRFHLATNIVNQLRPSDVRIASTKLIQRQVPRGIDLREPRNRAYLNCLARIARACQVLLEHSRGLERERLQSEMNAFVNRGTWTLHAGRPPRRRLRFGEFLYYRGAVSRQILEQALAWQRRKRPLMGQLAMERGYATPADFANVLARMRKDEMFGAKACSMGVLKNGQVAEIVDEQKKYNCPIGVYFVDYSVLTNEQVATFHAEMRAHNAQFA